MSDAKYGKGFAFRMTILLGLLALVAAGFYYDRFVLAPQTKESFAAARKLMEKDPGIEISKKEVAETIGIAAATVDQQDGYEVETYQFKRALPFLKGDYLSVIYENDSLVNILYNKPYEPSAVKDKIEISGPGDDYTGNYPNVSGGGPPPGSDASDDDDTDDSDTDDSDTDDSDTDDSDTDDSDTDEDDGK